MHAHTKRRQWAPLVPRLALGVSHLLHEAFLGMRAVLFWAER